MSARRYHLMIGGPLDGRIIEFSWDYRAPISPFGSAMRVGHYYSNRFVAGRNAYRIGTVQSPPAHDQLFFAATALLALPPHMLDMIREVDQS
jgi:hypothetical protein